MFVKFILYVLIIPLGLNAPQKSKVRLMYAKGVEHKQSSVDLLKWLSTQPQTPFVVGYTGATKMLMAKHAVNPFNKMKNFNAGKKLLGQAIASDQKNLELIFLRYATQNETPSMLGYKDNLSADKAFILRNLRSVDDEELFNIVVKYMQTSKLNASEAQHLKKMQE
jgi:hypothetical protein